MNVLNDYWIGHSVCTMGERATISHQNHLRPKVKTN
jgi:hypothetical protein